MMWSGDICPPHVFIADSVCDTGADTGATRCLLLLWFEGNIRLTYFIFPAYALLHSMIMTIIKDDVSLQT